MKIKHEREIKPINEIHECFVKHFGSVTLAAEALGYKTRYSIYLVIHNGFTVRGKQRIKDKGYHNKFKHLY